MNATFNKTALSLALLATASLGVHAEGFYAGGSITTPDYGSSINGSGGDSGGSGYGGKLYGGYQITRNWAVEGGYYDLGRSKDINGTANARGLYVDGVGTYEFAPKWSLLGRAGVVEGHFTTSSGDDSSPGLKAGVGVQYDLTSNVALRVGYNRYHYISAYDSKPNVGEAEFGVKVGF